MDILTKEELKILKVLLDADMPLPGPEVVKRFLSQYNIVRTKSQEIKVYAYLSRLINKNYAASKKTGAKSTIYWPTVNRNEILRQESMKFLNTIFDGSLSSFVCHLASSGLSTEEIEKLKKKILNL